MCAQEKSETKSKETSGCWSGMGEMMKECCPDGCGIKSCFTMLKEMLSPKSGKQPQGEKS